LQLTVGLCAVGEFEILLPVAAAHYITNVKKNNKKMKKDFLPEPKLNSEPLPIDSTSSPNCTKPNVACWLILGLFFLYSCFNKKIYKAKPIQKVQYYIIIEKDTIYFNFFLDYNKPP
jgi:hypothetical protein